MSTVDTHAHVIVETNNDKGRTPVGVAVINEMKSKRKKGEGATHAFQSIYRSWQS